MDGGRRVGHLLAGLSRQAGRIGLRRARAGATPAPARRHAGRGGLSVLGRRRSVPPLHLRPAAPLLPHRPPRRAARVSAFVAVCAIVMLSPSPAWAAPFGGCTSPPTPESPGQGLAGFFLPTPDPLPEHENPFAPGAKTTAFEQYGLAGLSWYTYDLGCGGTVRDPSGSVSTWAARTLFIPAKSGIATVVGVTGAALDPTFLSAFDPLLSSLTQTLHDAVFSPIAPLAVMLTGLLLMSRSTRQRVSESTTAVGWAVLVMILAAAVFKYPEPAADTADKVIGGAVGVVSSGLTGSDEPPGDQIANELYNSFLYRMWATGEFCDPDSRAAQRYGPEILRAQAFSWAEAKEAKDKGSAGFVLTHQQGFDNAAQKVRDEDPVAYECLAGHGSASLEAAILADLGMLLIAPFLLIGGLILIAAYVIIRFAVIFAPALLTAGAFFPLRGVVVGAARVVAAAVINGILFTVCTLFVIRVDTTVLDPATNLPSWLRLVLLGVVTVVMWYLTRPFRKLTTMITPHSFAETLAEAGAGWRRRAGGFFRRQRDQRDLREILEETVGSPERGEAVPVDGRMREESRGPVGAVRRLRVTAERMPNATLAGGAVGGPPGLAGASRGALPAGPEGSGPPADLTGAALRADDGLPTGGPGPAEEGRAVPYQGHPRYPGYPGDPRQPVGVSAPLGGGLDGPGEPDPSGSGGGMHERSTVAPSESARSAQVPAREPYGPYGGDGLFNPGTPGRPPPEDDPRAHLRHLDVDSLDDEESYRLYDPNDDPLGPGNPWSR